MPEQEKKTIPQEYGAEHPEWVGRYYNDFGKMPAKYIKELESVIGFGKKKSDLLSKQLAIEKTIKTKETPTKAFAVKDPITEKVMPDSLKFKEGSSAMNTYLKQKASGEFLTEAEKKKIAKGKEKPLTESQKIDAENKKRKNLLGKANRAKENFEELKKKDPKSKAFKRMADKTKLDLDRFDFQVQYPDARKVVNTMFERGNVAMARFFIRERYGMTIEEFDNITK